MWVGSNLFDVCIWQIHLSKVNTKLDSCIAKDIWIRSTAGVILPDNVRDLFIMKDLIRLYIGINKNLFPKDINDTVQITNSGQNLLEKTVLLLNSYHIPPIFIW